MKKNIFIKCAFFLFLLNFIFSCKVYALDIKLLDLRDKIFKEANQIKQNIGPKNQDFVLLSGLFDSCILAVHQIDAYFYMVGIFELIRKEDVNKTSFNFLFSWLNIMRKTNNLNLQSVENAGLPTEGETKNYLMRIKSYFNELDKQITQEQERLNILMRVMKIK